MSPLTCANCRQLLQAEARACPSCGHGAGFDPIANMFRHLDTATGQWRDAAGQAIALKPCDNARFGVCNWLVETNSGKNLCRSCRHNRTIPDLSVPGVLQRWALAENAKHRVISSLILLGLPLETRAENPQGLAFDLLYDPSAEQGYAPQLLTGHAGGIVTLNLIETDDAARERIRRDMGEPYRTLIGHFRHEVAHHFWHRLVEFSPDLGPFRQRFGDERANYAAALASHYQNRQHPPLADWEEDYVSAYATVHPWEDFAETFAHYLHIVDTLASIGQFGMKIAAPPGAATPEVPVVDFDPYTADTPTLARCWIPFAFAINAINRSMGQPDLYPFRLTPAIMLKLDFINRLIAFTAGRWAPSEKEGADIKAMMAVLGLGVDLAS